MKYWMMGQSAVYGRDTGALFNCDAVCILGSVRAAVVIGPEHHFSAYQLHVQVRRLGREPEVHAFSATDDRVHMRCTPGTFIGQEWRAELESRSGRRYILPAPLALTPPDGVTFRVSRGLFDHRVAPDDVLLVLEVDLDSERA